MATWEANFGDAGIVPENAHATPNATSNAAHNNYDFSSEGTNTTTITITNLPNNNLVLVHNYHGDCDCDCGHGQGSYHPHHRDQNASVSSNNAPNCTDDGTVLGDSVTNHPRLSRDPLCLDTSLPFLPSSSRSHNHSLFATSGTILPRPVCPAPNIANLPWPRTGRVEPAACSALPPLFHPSLPTPSVQTPANSWTYPSTQPWTQNVIQTQASAPVNQDQLPSLASLGGPFPPPSGYSVHEPPRGHPIRPFSEIQGGSQNFSNAVSLSFLPPDAPPTALYQTHMNHTNFRPAPDRSQPQHLPRMTGTYRGNDDHFLSALGQNFTSPSLPPLSGPSSPTSLSLSNPSWAATVNQEMPSAIDRHTTTRGSGTIDLAKEEANLESTRSGVDPSIPFATMPTTTRTRSTPGSADSPTRKRRASTNESPPSRPSKTRRKETVANSNSPSSLFVDDDHLPGLPDDEEMETIDLSNATEVPRELIAPKVDNRVKLGRFQCVICMDDAAGLTVTHCGHLFCSECLHSSLHIDNMKRTCPVCRSKVDLRDRKGKAIKSFHHLELKVMTATKKGKRPADQ